MKATPPEGEKDKLENPAGLCRTELTHEESGRKLGDGVGVDVSGAAETIAVERDDEGLTNGSVSSVLLQCRIRAGSFLVLPAH